MSKANVRNGRGRRVGKGALAPCPPDIHAALILRSAFLRASRRMDRDSLPSFETPREDAAPQDEDRRVDTAQRRLCPPYAVTLFCAPARARFAASACAARSSPGRT